IASRMADEIERALADGLVLDDRALATLLLQLGEIRRADGNMDAAATAARRALEIQKRLGDGAAARWPARALLMTELQKKDRSQWKAYLLEILRELEADTTADPLALASVRLEVGHNMEFVEEYELGERLIREAMPDLEAKLPPNEHRVLGAYYALGSLLVAMDRSAEALPYLEELMRRKVSLLGEHDPNTSRSRLHLARALAGVGRNAEARAHFEQAVADLRKVGSFPQGPVMVATMQLGRLDLRESKWADAERNFREALLISDATGGPRGGNALEARYLLAESLAGQQRWDEALALLAECEPLVSWTMPSDAAWGVAYATALVRTNQAARAAPYLDRVDRLVAAKPERLQRVAAKAAALRAELRG
ncbi:MAG TPA: tetratricopeptide repeat protein, partial [Xanthomonadales bacterium]|nr:tetratricopeptide repeat protein [Xanthomonadales bacterium]